MLIFLWPKYVGGQASSAPSHSTSLKWPGTKIWSGAGSDLPDKETGKFHQLQLWFGWNCVGLNWGLDYILQASVKAWLCFSSKWWETLEGDQRYWGEIDLFKTKKRNWLKYFWPITTHQKTIESLCYFFGWFIVTIRILAGLRPSRFQLRKSSL